MSEIKNRSGSTVGEYKSIRNETLNLKKVAQSAMDSYNTNPAINGASRDCGEEVMNKYL